MAVTVAEVEVTDPPDAWTRAGFSVDGDGICRVGSVRIRLANSGGRGITSWSLRGLNTDLDLDGIPTRSSGTVAAEPATHPNGVTEIDHIVVLSPYLGRTVDALAAIDAYPRRERDGELGGRPIRQVFFRFGEVIIEVVGSPEGKGEGPSSLWGITYTVADIDSTAEFLGDRTTPVKDAVQPGRRITTLKHRDFGMSVRTAMISPHILGG